MSNEKIQAELEKYEADLKKTTAKFPLRPHIPEQGLYTPLDVEGMLVMQSPWKAVEGGGRNGKGAQSFSAPGVSSAPKESWSIAARRRRFGGSRRR